MFIYASVAYIAPLMGLRISKSHRHIRGPRCVFLYSETLRDRQSGNVRDSAAGGVHSAEFVHNARNNLPL